MWSSMASGYPNAGGPEENPTRLRWTRFEILVTPLYSTKAFQRKSCHCDRRRSDQSQSARNQSVERSRAYTFFSQAWMDRSHFLGTSEQVYEMLPGNHQTGHALGTQRGIYRKSKRQDRIAEVTATL